LQGVLDPTEDGTHRAERRAVSSLTQWGRRTRSFTESLGAPPAADGRHGEGAISDDGWQGERGAAASRGKPLKTGSSAVYIGPRRGIRRFRPIARRFSGCVYMLAPLTAWGSAVDPGPVDARGAHFPHVNPQFLHTRKRRVCDSGDNHGGRGGDRPLMVGVFRRCWANDPGRAENATGAEKFGMDWATALLEFWPFRPSGTGRGAGAGGGGDTEEG